jgi:Ca2+-binding RTX toxin-like protein
MKGAENIMQLRRAALFLTLLWLTVISPLTATPAAADPLYCDGLPATQTGTDASETITGTTGNDVIVALGGNDTIYGGPGDDTICAGTGSDFVDGERGSDHIYGGNHHDWLDGGNGDDTLFGEAGNDFLTGNDGVDALDGGAGFDLLTEQLDSTAGNTLLGGSDADTLIGGMNEDVLNGERGNDQLDGVGELIGGNGNDELTARGTGVMCEGGDGTDKLIGTLWEPAADSCLSTTDIEVIGGWNDPLVGVWWDEAYVRRLPGDELFVMLHLTGLDPSTVYPWRIHVGVDFGCSGGEPLADELELQSYPDIVTDSNGDAFLAVTLAGDLDVDRVATTSTEVGYAIVLFDGLSVPAPADPVGLEVRCVGPLSRTPLPHPSQSSHGW